MANVVQVITDNASNYVLVGKLLEEKHNTIFWTPCAAHCIDLMLDDIGKIDWVKNTVDHAKSITKLYLQPFIDFEPHEETHWGQGYY